MENSAKALEIAAVVLVTVTLLSLAAYLFVSTGISSGRFYDKIEENQTNQYNSNFLKYDGLETCTAHDIVTVANFAKDNNQKYELGVDNANPNTYYITVMVKEKNGSTYDHFELFTEDNYLDFISDSLVNDNDNHRVQKKYQCVARISETTKRVYRMEFIGL